MITHTDVISVTDLRTNTREILENAHFRGRHYTIERAGSPMAVILDVAEYERWRKLAEAMLEQMNSQES